MADQGRATYSPVHRGVGTNVTTKGRLGACPAAGFAQGLPLSPPAPYPGAFSAAEAAEGLGQGMPISVRRREHKA